MTNVRPANGCFSAAMTLRAVSCTPAWRNFSTIARLCACANHVRMFWAVIGPIPPTLAILSAGAEASASSEGNAPASSCATVVPMPRMPSAASTRSKGRSLACAMAFSRLSAFLSANPSSVSRISLVR